MRRAEFITLSSSFLNSINSHNENIPTNLYSHPNPFVRWFFWFRLKNIFILIKNCKYNSKVLDLGCGGGVFFPSLSKLFKKVYAVDLSTIEAKRIKRLYQLENIKIITGDLRNQKFSRNSFDLIIAADILEHIRNLSDPVKNIIHWLKPGGRLIVSGPKENWLHKLGRTVFRLVPPSDHYHTVDGIEKELVKNGFYVSERIYLPWGSRLSLFSPVSTAVVIEVRKKE